MLTRRDEQSKRALLNQLRNIDAHMEKKGRFLTGDTMCCFDCELMPRLQHIRVAGNLGIFFKFIKYPSILLFTENFRLIIGKRIM